MKPLAVRCIDSQANWGNGRPEFLEILSRLFIEISCAEYFQQSPFKLTARNVIFESASWKEE